MVVVVHHAPVAEMCVGGGLDAHRRLRQVAGAVGTRDDERHSPVALLTAVEQPQHRLDDPARLLVIVERDRTLVEPRVRIRGGMATGDDRVAAEVFVGHAELVHVAPEPERVHLGGRADPEGRVPVERARPGLRHRLAEASARSLVERAVDEHGVRRARRDGDRGVLHGGVRARASIGSARPVAHLLHAERAHEIELAARVDRERHHAVDVGGREAGVDDRRARRLGRELQLAPTRVLRELGLADAGDDRVAVHASPTGRNTGSSTPSCSR